MRDLFKDLVSDREADQAISAMSLTPQYTYQIVTAHTERMKHYFQARRSGPTLNILLGCVVEKQQDLHEQSTHLDQLHARGWRTFYLLEPLLEPVNLHLSKHPVDWVVVGGECGEHARAFYLDWAQGLIEQCISANIPIFIKQLGSNVWISRLFSTPEQSNQSGRRLVLEDPLGANLKEWPVSLQVRQKFPRKPF